MVSPWGYQPHDQNSISYEADCFLTYGRLFKRSGKRSVPEYYIFRLRDDFFIILFLMVLVFVRQRKAEFCG